MNQPGRIERGISKTTKPLASVNAEHSETVNPTPATKKNPVISNRWRGFTFGEQRPRTCDGSRVEAFGKPNRAPLHAIRLLALLGKVLPANLKALATTDKWSL
jgi:hypothetical protein